MGKEKQHIWLRQDLKSGEVLELVVPPPNIRMEDVGQWVRWGLVIYWHKKPALGTSQGGANGG